MQPLDHPVAEAVAVAKRDLSAGDTLGMIGESGLSRLRHDLARCPRIAAPLPLGLAERAKVVKPIKAGDVLTYDNCVPDDSMVITQIRRRLDQGDSRFLTTAA